MWRKVIFSEDFCKWFLPGRVVALPQLGLSLPLALICHFIVCAILLNVLRASDAVCAQSDRLSLPLGVSFNQST